MLSQTTEYALRAAVFLSKCAPTPQTTRQISDNTHVPAPYLAKILQGLSRAGITSSQRGSGGGFVLSRSVAGLTLLQIVNAVDPIRRITTCPLNLTGHGSDLCPLHRRLDDTIALVEQNLATTTLEEILSSPSQIVPLCPFPFRKCSQPQDHHSPNALPGDVS